MEVSREEITAFFEDLRERILNSYMRTLNENVKVGVEEAMKQAREEVGKELADDIDRLFP